MARVRAAATAPDVFRKMTVAFLKRSATVSGKRKMSHAHESPSDQTRAGSGLIPLVSTPSAPAVDPVCGMTVDPATARASWVHEGQTYYFCCPSCRDRLQADPQRWTAARAEQPPPAPTSTDPFYTCPTPPDVRRRRPAP